MAESRQPRIARHKAYYTELEPGRTCLWCGCGRSRSQPYCDGSHQGTGFRPVRYTAAERGEEVLFCGCKHTKTPPFCDGSHNDLLADYPEDDPGSEANRAIPEAGPRNGRPDHPQRRLLRLLDRTRAEDRAGRAPLLHRHRTGSSDRSTSRSSISRPATATRRWSPSGSATWSCSSPGARPRSPSRGGRSPRRSTPGSTSPPGRRSASPERPAAPSRSWRRRVRARAHPNGSIECRTTSTRPTRSVSLRLDPSQRQGMANRYFQMLVDRVGGLDGGHPVHRPHPALEGRAPPRHLYEEALIILTGAGCNVDREPQGPPGRGGGRRLPAAQAAPFPRSDQPRRHAGGRHHLSRRQPPRSTTEPALRSDPAGRPASSGPALHRAPAASPPDRPPCAGRARPNRRAGRAGCAPDGDRRRRPRGGSRAVARTGASGEEDPHLAHVRVVLQRLLEAPAGSAPAHRGRARGQGAARPPPGCCRRGSAG